MSNSVKVKVKVLATLHQDEGVHFHCTWADSSGAWQSGAITIPHGYSRNKIDFRLDDRTGLDLQFLEEPNDAIWFNADSCPCDASGNDLGQIRDKEVHKDFITRKRKKLTLTDLNTQECTLHYALRFSGERAASGASPPYVCDPEIRNRGGGGED